MRIRTALLVAPVLALVAGCNSSTSESRAADASTGPGATQQQVWAHALDHLRRNGGSVVADDEVPACADGRPVLPCINGHARHLHDDMTFQVSPEALTDERTVDPGDQPATRIESVLTSDGHYYVRFSEKECWLEQPADFATALGGGESPFLPGLQVLLATSVTSTRPVPSLPAELAGTAPVALVLSYLAIDPRDPGPLPAGVDRVPVTVRLDEAGHVAGLRVPGIRAETLTLSVTANESPERIPAPQDVCSR